MPARGARALARGAAGRAPVPGVRRARDRPAGGATSRGDRGPRRRRPGARPPSRAGARARAARRGAPVSRASARPADARALPLRPAGRRAPSCSRADAGRSSKSSASTPGRRSSSSSCASSVKTRAWTCRPRDAHGAQRRRGSSPVGAPPPVRYARSGDLSIAYQVTGDGPIDLVLISGFVSHLEKDWEEPRHAHFLDRLGSIARLIRFDKRGTGLSDRPPGVPDLESRMDDVRAVMDAAASERAVLFGYSEGAPMAILFAATYPAARTRAGPLRRIRETARSRRRLPVGADPGGAQPPTSTIWSRLGLRVRHEDHVPVRRRGDGALVGRALPRRRKPGRDQGADGDELAGSTCARCCRPIHVPTLVVHRGTDFDVRVEEGRYIAERIAGARFVELPGAITSSRSTRIRSSTPSSRSWSSAARAPPRGRGSSPGDAARHRYRRLDAVGRGARRPCLGDLVERYHDVVRSELTRFRGRELDGRGRHARHSSTARRARSAARRRSVSALRPLGLGSGRDCTQARSSAMAIAFAASPCRSPPASPLRPHPARCSCRRPSTTSSPAPGSNSPTAGSRALTGVPGEWRLLAVVDPERGGTDALRRKSPLCRLFEKRERRDSNPRPPA